MATHSTFPIPDWDRPAFERRRSEAMAALGQVKVPDEATAPAFCWTSRPPTQPGWFFNRPRWSGGGAAVPVYVFERDGYFFALDPSAQHEWDVRAMLCDWSSSPLPEPVE